MNGSGQENSLKGSPPRGAQAQRAVHRAVATRDHTARHRADCLLQIGENPSLYRQMKPIGGHWRLPESWNGCEKRNSSHGVEFLASGKVGLDLAIRRPWWRWNLAAARDGSRAESARSRGESQSDHAAISGPNVLVLVGGKHGRR